MTFAENSQRCALNTMRRKVIYFINAYLVFSMSSFFGLRDYWYAETFENFDYPLNDIKKIAKNVMAGEMSPIPAINFYPYKFLTNDSSCSSYKIDLLIVVRSAMSHFNRRNAIRKTYGQDNNAFNTIKTLFFLGVNRYDNALQDKIDKEIAEYKDIIQMDFADDYRSNTIKTMMSFRWIYEHCSTVDFYLFTDDDMYISTTNLFTYIYNHEINEESDPSTKRNEYFYAGYVIDTAPQRWRTSYWRVSLEEYPWNRYPPYVGIRAYIMSNKTVKIMFVASFFVKHFRFDDIYLGIIANKLDIKLTHCSTFHYYKRDYRYKDDYMTVIASHGYEDYRDLIRVWNEQNTS